MPSESAAAYYCHSSVRTWPFWVFIITQPRNSLMNPADRHHSQFPAASKDCSTLFNLNNPYHNHSKSANTSNFIFPNHHSSGGGSRAPNNNVHNSINPNNRNNTNNNSGSSHAHATMGGQTPVFFSPSSFVVGSHKSSQELHDAMLNANKQLSNRSGPLQLVDFKEGIRGGGEGVNGMIGAASEEVRMAKRPHISFVRGGQDYDPGPGSTRSAGEDMSVDYVDQMDGGDYLDPLEGVGELMKKGSRRLGYDQVKALEKAFENENRLEPERKVRLASQLGLQPRQVAVWFQNRRARWKTKQMERDYTLLKNKFEALKADRDKLLQEKDHLQAELARLKGNPPPVDSMPENKEATEGEQSSPTLASCLVVVDDAAPHQQAKGSNQATRSHRADEQVDEEIEEEEEVAEEEASPSNRMMHEQKLQQNDSLSSTEDSDMNNGGTIVNSSSKAFQEEADYYTQQWRLPQAPTQLLYKPTSIKNEEWPEHAENMNSFNMHLDANWYNWGC